MLQMPNVPGKRSVNLLGDVIDRADGIDNVAVFFLAMKKRLKRNLGY